MLLTETSTAVSFNAAPKQVREAVEVYQQALAALRTVERDINAISHFDAETRKRTLEHTAALRQAREADSALYARALKSGEPDPGAPDQDALQLRLAELERLRGARKVLVQEAREHTNREIERHVELWRSAERKIIAKQRTRITELADELAATLAELARASGVVGRIEHELLELDPAERTPTGLSIRWTGQRLAPGSYISPRILVDVLTKLAQAPEPPESPRQDPARLYVQGGHGVDLADVAASGVV